MKTLHSCTVRARRFEGGRLLRHSAYAYCWTLAHLFRSVPPRRPLAQLFQTRSVCPFVSRKTMQTGKEPVNVSLRLAALDLWLNPCPSAEEPPLENEGTQSKPINQKLRLTSHRLLMLGKQQW